MNGQQQIRLVLLYTLEQLSGGAEKHTVLKYIDDYSYWYINDENETREYSRTSEKQWCNDFSFARQRLVEGDYMDKESARGWWELTPKGESYLSELITLAQNYTISENSRITAALLRDIFLSGQREEIAADQQLIM